MPETFQVEINPRAFIMAKGTTVEATATVRNQGETVVQVAISIEGIDPTWYSLPVSSVALFPNDRDSFKIMLHPPDALETHDGSYPFYVNIASQENRERGTRLQLTIEIRSRARVGLSISPASLIGRKGSYLVTVSNASDAEAVVSLKSGDTPDLICNLSVKQLTIPPHGHADSSLDVATSWLSFITGPEKIIPVEIIATPVQAPLLSAEAVTVNSQFTSRPWYRALATTKIPWFGKPPVIREFKLTTQDNKEFKITWKVTGANSVTLNNIEVDLIGETLVRPAEPETYRLMTQNKHGAVSQQVEAIPLLPPRVRTSERVHLALAPVELKANAGQMSAQTTVTIQNLGEVVDKFLITIDGLAEDWYNRGASSISLYPQKVIEIAMNLLPPKKKGVKSGFYTFGVSVQAQSQPQEMATVIGRLEVLPFPEYRLEIRPVRVACHRKGNYRVVLNNTGVTDIEFILSATDMDEGCRFRFNSEKVRVNAWDTREIPLRVKPKRNFILGEKKRYDLTIIATPVNGAAQRVSAELNHSPLMASWKPIYRIIRAIIILAILTWGLIWLIDLGGGWDILMKDYKKWFWNLEYVLQGWIQILNDLINKLSK
jgi:hypothetical protein